VVAARQGQKRPSVKSQKPADLTQDRFVAKRFRMVFVDGLHVHRQNKNFAVQVL